MSSSFCDNILLHDNINVFGNGIGIAMIALSTIYLATSFLLLYFVKVQEYYAKRTDSKAVRIVIFPIYSYILWANAIVNFYVGMVGLYYTFQPFENSGDVVSAWAFAFMWGIQHMVVEGVPIMLMQKGLGTYAVKQSLKQSALWGVYTMFNTLAIYKTNTTGSFCFSMVWQTILLVYYFCLWALPQKRLFRRPAAINYAMFWCLFRVLSILATVLFFVRTTHSEGNCIYVIGTLFPYAILEPFVIYYTLLQDSKWWQGLDIMQGRRFSTVEEIRSPLAGIDLNLSSAQSLAASMDNMSLGAHSQGKAQVRLLNFAYITLDKTRQLGSGSFSKVYLGSYRKERCAIKMIFTLDLTQDVIRRVAAEAQILSMIKHKNIVSILGVSVLPPSVCILLELCVFGSLADVIKATGPLTGFVAHEHSQQQQSTGMSLSWPDRLYLAVGCVRGLNALHSYNNELCHRDIKSFNFLVDEHLNAKISDLELGITEDIHVTANASALARLKQKTSSFFGPKVSKFSVNSGSDAEQVSELGIGEGVLRADDFLANWSAPEVIKDGCHVQASDMYSFSLVLWEILTGLVPFSEIKRQDDIRYKVLSGDRPAMPLCVFEGAAQQKYYEHYTALITRGWQHEAALRPSASEMLSELECIWLGCCSSILHDTEVQPDLNEIYDDHRSRRQSRFSMWSTLTPSTANASAAPPSQIVTEQSVTRICDMMQSDQESFEAMDNHSGAWVIITHECPHVVLRCNAAFSSLTGVQLNDIIGLPLRDTFIFGEQTETAQTEEFLAGLRANRSTATHTVLTLYHSIVLAGTLKFQSPNLYSLHAFPIFKRSGGNNGSGSHPVPLEPELPVCTEVDGEADAASQLSAPVHSPVSMSSSLPNLSTMRALNISSTNLDAVSAAHSGNAPNQERAVSNDATIDALPVGSTAEVPSTLSRLSSSLLASRPSILQHRMSTTSNADQSVTSGTSGAAGQSSQTAGRSFFGFSGKRAKTASHQSLSNLMETSQQRAARPVAMVAVLFSKLKDLSPPKEQTTNRSSGIFRHNSSDNMSRLASQSKSNQNSESLASALMQERLSEV